MGLTEGHWFEDEDTLNERQLENEIEYGEKRYQAGYEKGYADALELLKEREAPTVGGWISVKDEMPELGQEVLVYAIGKIDGFIGDRVYAICKRYIQHILPSSPGHEVWSTPWQYFHTDYGITYWMPLPEPPKEDKVNEMGSFSGREQGPLNDGTGA